MPDIYLVLGLLVAVAALATVGRWISVPYPIILVLGGLVLALIPGLPTVRLSSKLVLLVFLPPLIYGAAQGTSWQEVRGNARPILYLAVGLVLVSMGAVALVFHALEPSLPWAAALTLGAIVSPPDPVAATAIAETLHLPRRLVSILEGEGLSNDGTALVAFQVASAAVVTGTFSVEATSGRFLYAVIVGVAIGFAVGWLGRQVLRQVTEPAVENTIALLLPFAAYLSSDELGASGVLAVLAAALYLSRFSPEVISSAGRLQGQALWGMIEFILNGLSFLLIGLQLRSIVEGLSGGSFAAALGEAALVCLIVVVVRPVWVFLTARLSERLRRVRERSAGLSNRSLLVVSWAGMRGVVSMAAALSVPQLTSSGQPFPGRDLIIFITFAVILVTLVGQGLTLSILARWLGVGGAESDLAQQELAARLRLAHAALDRLDALADGSGAPAAAVERFRVSYSERIEQLRKQSEALGQVDSHAGSHAAQAQAVQRLRGELLDAEQDALSLLRASGRINIELAQRLQHGLDVERLRGSR